MPAANPILARGNLHFSIESRIIRELGERLVKQGSVALLELIKNSYDADATTCTIHASDKEIVVSDNGVGMSFTQFETGWMRIGTSSKEADATSKMYGRDITGEKGIGRFAVRFLGTKLQLETTAEDEKRKYKTTLTATFDWPTFDKDEDLGKVNVPYILRRADDSAPTGTVLTITTLRDAGRNIDVRSVRTGSVGIVSPYAPLFRPKPTGSASKTSKRRSSDPGFSLKLVGDDDNEGKAIDLAALVLGRFVLKAVLELTGTQVSLNVWRRDAEAPVLSITDTVAAFNGGIYADIRFFPQRAGTFSHIGLDGRVAKGWVKRHGGIAVFDRRFRVHPYGYPGDDWLALAQDSAKNEREPRSSIAKKFFPMTDSIRQSTKLNYMLRLPHSEQLVGCIEVAATRNKDAKGERTHDLIPAADREGFVDNKAYAELKNLIRGAVEAIAYIDRQIQQEEERAEAADLLRQLRDETREAIEAIESDHSIPKATRLSLVRGLVNSQRLVEESADAVKKSEETLEVMSLLGVIAGFMTHEFGTAIDDLERARGIVEKLSSKHPELKAEAAALEKRLGHLRDFVTYSQGYIRGASGRPEKSYPAKPRVLQVIRVFGQYATDRDIEVTVDIDSSLAAPNVPVSLYNGIALNLFTNALKAVTVKTGSGERQISFRAWNEKGKHFLQVSDTGIGLPASLRSRVFDPLFTTTSSNRDPLGSGMGLGLTLVRRGVEAFGGRVAAIEPPPGFSTCFNVELPLSGD